MQVTLHSCAVRSRISLILAATLRLRNAAMPPHVRCSDQSRGRGRGVTKTRGSVGYCPLRLRRLPESGA
jgi:hypothetical protein